MIDINLKENISLSSYTTLRVGGNAKYFFEVSSVDSLRKICKWAEEKNERMCVIGGGSNILVSDKGFDGVVVKINFDEIFAPVLNKSSEVYVTCGAGKELDSLVEETVQKGLWGMENLSGIPGSVGAVPIQNVGAYGIEVSDLITSVVAYDIESDLCIVFSNKECQFGYRESLFKNNEKKNYVILWVTFKLYNDERPKLSYNDLTRYFKENKYPTQKEIRKAIIEIRSRKFPDWKKIGTAGSFFKNPIVTKDEFIKLRGKHPSIPGFVLENGNIKVPLGFILDRILNLKGINKGHVGLFKNQALVLVNHGGATALEITNFVEEIIQEVKDTTGIKVEWEVTKL